MCGILGLKGNISGVCSFSHLALAGHRGSPRHTPPPSTAIGRLSNAPARGSPRRAPQREEERLAIQKIQLVFFYPNLVVVVFYYVYAHAHTIDRLRPSDGFTKLTRRGTRYAGLFIATKDPPRYTPRPLARLCANNQQKSAICLPLLVAARTRRNCMEVGRRGFGGARKSGKEVGTSTSPDHESHTALALAKAPGREREGGWVVKAFPSIWEAAWSQIRPSFRRTLCT
jgi:hypothetical protein